MTPAPVVPQQGDIYWVHIPPEQTVGSEDYGKPNRLCVVMSRNNLNRRLNTLVVVPLTTHGGQVANLGEQPPFRIIIPSKEITKDVLCNTQPVLCVAKTDQVRVIDKSRLMERMGKLSRNATISVGVGVSFVFDLR